MATVKNFIHRKKQDGLLDIEYHPKTNKFQVVGLLGDDGKLHHDMAGPTAVAEMRDAFIESYRKSYKEITKTDGVTDLIEIWEDDTKLVHLFTKTLSYNLNKKVQQIVTTNHLTGGVLTKTLTYPTEDTITITEEITNV